VISKYVARRKNRVAAGTENIGDGVGWVWGQCTQLKAGPRADAPTNALLVQSAVLRSHVVRLSVRPSVTLVICDHISWKSWKLIVPTISPTPSLCVAQRRSTYSQRNMGKFWGDRGWVGKMWHARAQKRQYL